jgi:hypothetical protein
MRRQAIARAVGAYTAARREGISRRGAVNRARLAYARIIEDTRAAWRAQEPMTKEQFQRDLVAWAGKVQAEAERLFESGVDANECIALAINVNAARERKRQLDQQRFLNLPRGLRPSRN